MWFVSSKGIPFIGLCNVTISESDMGFKEMMDGSKESLRNQDNCPGSYQIAPGTIRCGSLAETYSAAQRADYRKGR